MLKKIIVGLLVLSIMGAGAYALLGDEKSVASETPEAVASTTTYEPVTSQTNGTPQSIQASVNNVGEVWSGRGTILELTTMGMTLALDDGSEVYVELGSPDYWQTQGVTLNAGGVVTVDGFFNGTDYHARTVTNSDGAILSLRNEAGQPLWSGGSTSSGTGEFGGQGQVQIPADQWVTVEGSVTALTNNGVILQTPDAQTLTISFGRADGLRGTLRISSAQWPMRFSWPSWGDASKISGSYITFSSFCVLAMWKWGKHNPSTPVSPNGEI